eukprot:COSAG01_NODE_1212_length_11214_cov_31.716689_2_plen_309_part_00
MAPRTPSSPAAAAAQPAPSPAVTPALGPATPAAATPGGALSLPPRAQSRPGSTSRPRRVPSAVRLPPASPSRTEAASPATTAAGAQRVAQGAAALGGSATALELPSVDDEVDWADFPEVMRRVHDAQVQGYAFCHPGWERRERATGAATDAPSKKKKRVEKPHTLLRAWIWHDDHPPAGEVTVHVRDSSLGDAASLFHVLGCGPRRTVLGRSAGGRVHLRVLSTFSMPRLTVRAARARALANQVDVDSFPEAYTAASFAAVTVERGGASAARTEPAWLITDGPLASFACNTVRGTLPCACLGGRVRAT